MNEPTNHKTTNRRANERMNRMQTYQTSVLKKKKKSSQACTSSILLSLLILRLPCQTSIKLLHAFISFHYKVVRDCMRLNNYSHVTVLSVHPDCNKTATSRHHYLMQTAHTVVIDSFFFHIFSSSRFLTCQHLSTDVLF